MSERRMFTKKIIDSDAFTELPPTTQALYFHLCMNADDDGFNNKIRQAMFNAHADRNDDDLLINKRFIIPFEDKGVIVIKHWRLHNIIRNDRYHKTEYLEEKARLILKDNGVYTQNDNQTTTKCLPSDNQMETEVSIGKVSIGKSNIYSTRFEEFWSAYKKKRDKKRAYDCYNARLKDGFSEEELLTACHNYMNECEKEDREERYIKDAKTFLSINTPFVDYLPKEPVKAELNHKIFDDKEQYIPPYFGFPKEWFDGDNLVNERVTPIVRPVAHQYGWYEEKTMQPNELIEDYEARRSYYEQEHNAG